VDIDVIPDTTKLDAFESAIEFRGPLLRGPRSIAIH